MKDVNKSHILWILKQNYNVEGTHLLFWNEAGAYSFSEDCSPSIYSLMSVLKFLLDEKKFINSFK